MKIYSNHKQLFFSIFITVSLLTNSLSGFGQIFDSEQNPPGVKWRQINTENFQIIYPSSLESEAQRMANTLQKIIGRVGASLHKTPRKISVILQNQGTESNGFVQLAPRRSEFFTTPSQDFDYQDWLNSLAVHELRHVVQFEKISGKLKAPFFEELALAIFGINLPPWFYEGDAVGTETALTDAGRGRLPGWDIVFRSNTLSGQKFSYSKNYFGSVKDKTPGYYQLGFYLTSKLRRDFGKGIMDSIMSRVARQPWRPYNLSNSIKKFTGLSTRKLHDSLVAELSGLWSRQAAQSYATSYPSLNKRKDLSPADYLLPAAVSGSEILTLKYSKARTAEFVLIDEKRLEKRLLKIGYQEVPNFNYAAGKIVWDEARFDKRYQKRSYNVINIFDLATRSYRQLTHRSRLFAPALSADGKFVAAVNVALNNSMSIVLLDAATGKTLKEFQPSLKLNLQTPSFNAAGNKIILTGINNLGAALFELDIRSGNFGQVLPFEKQLLGKPIYARDQIIFRAAYNGLDNLYRLKPGSDSVFQISSAPYGASNPFFDSKSGSLFFNNYQPRGNDISSIPFEENSGIAVGSLKNTFIDYAAPLAAQEPGGNVFNDIPHDSFASKPYSEWKNLFYFHSLVPIADNPGFNSDLNPGVQLLSNNKLNTLDFYTGYQYNTSLRRSEYMAGFTYKRFYPVVDISYTNKPELTYMRLKNGSQTTYIPVSWRENFTEARISIPFMFNRLNQNYNFGFRLSSSLTTRYDIENRPNNFTDRLNFPMKYQVYLNRNTRRSSRDLAPRWGENLTFTYQNLAFDKRLNGELFSFKSTFYSPGILSNHSLQTRFSYQFTNGAYQYTTDIPRVSGYSNLKTAAKLSNTLLFSYRFPLFYPDWELGPLAYVKRIRGGFFADFENVGKTDFSPRTYGLEVHADMNLLRFYLPNFDVGGKFIFVNDKNAQKPIFETIFTYSY